MDKRSTYLLGIGVGLIISWVTSALAYLKAGFSTYTTLILFELFLSIIFMLVAYLIDTERKKWKTAVKPIPPTDKSVGILGVIL